MKKYFFLVLTILAFTTVGHAQPKSYSQKKARMSAEQPNRYSKKNLSKSSTEQLESLLIKAKKQRKAGWITLGSGALIFSTGVYLFVEVNDSGFYETSTSENVGAIMTLVGAVGILVGTPILISGSTRVSKVNKALNNKASISLVPYNQKFPTTNNNQYGLTLKLNF